MRNRNSAGTQQSALLFIPMISGFTTISSDTAATHARYIIAELLDVLIGSNTLGLEVSQVESEAIIFFRRGGAPTATQLMDQIKKMFINFHQHLKQYQANRICQCSACSSTNRLSIKFAGHYGQISENRIRGKSILFGKNVVVVHRLLNNSVTDREYAIFSSALVNSTASWDSLPVAKWASIKDGKSRYDIGTIGYSYLSLAPLYRQVPDPIPEEVVASTDAIEFLTYEGEIAAPVSQVFNIVSDLAFRPYWIINVKGIDRLNYRIIRNGSTYRYASGENGEDPLHIFHDLKVQGKTISFQETSQQSGNFNLFMLKPVEDDSNSTRILVKVYRRKSRWIELIFQLFVKKRMLRAGQDALKKLNEYCDQLLKKGALHPSAIVLDGILPRKRRSGRTGSQRSSQSLAF